MNTGVIRSMLLLDEPNISGLRLGIESYSKVFLSVAFVGAISWEFLTGMKFLEVVKNLVLALVFMGCFYGFHTKAVDLSFQASEELLREVSPRNIFLKKWNEVKVKPTEKAKGNFIDKMVIPNLNDLLGTALFLMSKVCILILKLIYTTVYYFTFIFAPITAVLSFLPVSKHSMTGTITSSLWCILLPFVLVVFLALVGNAVQMPAENGQLAVSSMDQLIWIFGITLLMLLAPSFTYSLIKGSVASTADAVGVKMTGIGAQALVALPIIYGLGQKVLGKGKGKGKGNKDKKNNLGKGQNLSPYLRSYYPGRNSSQYNKQSSLKGSGGLKTERSNQNSVKLSEIRPGQQNINQNSNATPASPVLRASSNSSSANNENGKSKTDSSKIPVGSLSSVDNQNQNRGARISIKSNLDSKFNSNFIPNNSQASTKNTMPKAMPTIKSIFKQVLPAKIASVRTSLPRLQAKLFKTVIPRERQYDV